MTRSVGAGSLAADLRGWLCRFGQLEALSLDNNSHTPSSCLPFFRSARRHPFPFRAQARRPSSFSEMHQCAAPLDGDWSSSSPSAARPLPEHCPLLRLARLRALLSACAWRALHLQSLRRAEPGYGTDTHMFFWASLPVELVAVLAQRRPSRLAWFPLPPRRHQLRQVRRQGSPVQDW